jgi:hypothetical protein
MYKDIFITGNMRMFDLLDPEIEDYIIDAASYNPRFKPKGKIDKESRGGLYFVEKEARNKSATVCQLSNSFVLLATEIIYHFAQWLP